MACHHKNIFDERIDEYAVFAENVFANVPIKHLICYKNPQECIETNLNWFSLFASIILFVAIKFTPAKNNRISNIAIVTLIMRYWFSGYEITHSSI